MLYESALQRIALQTIFPTAKILLEFFSFTTRYTEVDGRG